MKSESSGASWLKFFTAAGIPRSEAENYAVTFSKNQIQLDMLPEIKKEYLKDMGITLMGHIIAILRHAKAVYADELKKTELTPSQKQSALSLQKTKSASKDTVKAANKVDEADTKPAPPLKRKSTIVQLKPVEEPKTKVRKKLCDSSDDVRVYIPSNNLKSSSEISTQNTNFEVSCDENKKGVFKRLGSEVVNTYTPTSSYPEPSTSAVGVSESVFTRLGGKTAPPLATKDVTTSTEHVPLKRVVASKVISNPSASTKGIIRTRLDNKPQLSKTRILVSPSYMDTVREDKGLLKKISSTYMDRVKNERGVKIPPTYMDRQRGERGIIVSPTYMDGGRDEGDLLSRLSSGPFYGNPSYEKKINIKTRLGKTSSQPLNARTRLLEGAEKKVSFGSVYQKLIPRERKTIIRNRPFSLDFGTQKGSMGLSTGVFSRLGNNLY